MRRLILAAGLLALASAPAVRAQSPATNLNGNTSSDGGPESQGGVAIVPNGHIAWPVANPVWEFDFYRPANRTTPLSSGLEIRNVTYLGRRVLDRASVPVLNVEYDAGGCGCYRDWQYSESPYEATAAASGTSNAYYIDAIAGSVITNCERATTGPATDLGSFRGVAVEDYGRELVLTGHMSAGWYRYRMKWHFYTDGRIWPEYSFASAPSSCTNRPRRHHAYWRFDFDLEDTPDNDVVSETSTAGVTTTIETESARSWGTPQNVTVSKWTVTDATTNAGFTIEPGAEDLLLGSDAFSKTDALVLRYHTNEITDGVDFGSGCAFTYEPWLNNESVDGSDNVFWYRSSSARSTGTCELRGPTLRAFGYTAVASEGTPQAIQAVEVQAATPNPFTPQTSVRFRVAEAQDVRVVLYDALGRRIKTLFEAPVEAGVYETVDIQGGEMPAGTYVVRVEGTRAAASTRIVLTR